MKLTDHCFAVTGLYYIPPWSVNAGFIIGEKKTLIIDSGSNYISAQTIYGYAKTAKPDNELLLINTERHLDHIGGNSYFFEKGISIYGHFLINRNQNELTSMIDDLNQSIPQRMRKEANEGLIAFGNTRIVNPDHKIMNNTSIDLGEISVRVILTPGHTKTNLSVFHEKDKVIFCGDCILPEFIPNLEEGNRPEWKIWIESLEIIKNLNGDILVPGHGNVITGKSNILKEIDRTKDVLLNAVELNKAPIA